VLPLSSDYSLQSFAGFTHAKRAEHSEGFDQTLGFIVPDEFTPRVITEAKLTEDDGTARDKVARFLRLQALSVEGRERSDPKYEVVACIAGRGWQRPEDMRRLLFATRGKVFTLKTLDRLVDCTALRNYRTKTQ
jgi:hypothetical protein